MPKKVSVIMNVYNEERFLPAVLRNIVPHVDEIVAVDGSAEGPSTDKTAKILKAEKKVVYKSGKFVLPDGGWDASTQRNTGTSLATGDVLIFLSADMLFYGLADFRELIDGTDYKLYFTSTIEFWQDSRHLRLYSDEGDKLTVPSTILQVTALDRSLSPVAETGFSMRTNDADVAERVLMPSVIKFHLGWIRPFAEQVEKHIRHVQQGRWGEYGDSLRKGKFRDLKLWAILHVLGYNQTPSVAYAGPVPEEMADFAEMKHLAGYQEIARDFEKEYGVSVLQMQTRGKKGGDSL
jgi:glycosyltransferase involved in cell wall biosynthesis